MSVKIPPVSHGKRKVEVDCLIWRVASRSHPGGVHEVGYIPATRKWFCDPECEGYRYHGKCAHIEFVQQYGEY